MAVLALCGTVVSCKTSSGPSTADRVIVLGFDGMDPRFVEQHFEQLPKAFANHLQIDCKMSAPCSENSRLSESLHNAVAYHT